MFTIKVVSKIYDIGDGFAKCRFQNECINNGRAAWSRGVWQTPAVCAERKMDCGAPTREALYYIYCVDSFLFMIPQPLRARARYANFSPKNPSTLHCSRYSSVGKAFANEWFGLLNPSQTRRNPSLAGARFWRINFSKRPPCAPKGELIVAGCKPNCCA